MCLSVLIVTNYSYKKTMLCLLLQECALIYYNNNILLTIILAITIILVITKMIIINSSKLIDTMFRYLVADTSSLDCSRGCFFCTFCYIILSWPTWMLFSHQHCCTYSCCFTWNQDIGCLTKWSFIIISIIIITKCSFFIIIIHVHDAEPQDSLIEKNSNISSPLI